jgi:hypothetical protein
MKTTTSTSSESVVDVRFSRIFAILIILISHAPLVFAAQQIIALRHAFFQGTNFIIPSLALLLGIIIVVAGMSQPKRWYLRLNRDTKLLMISYGIGSWSKKHPYDSISFIGGKFQIEKGDLRKKIGFVKLACNRKDLKSLALSINQAS